MAKLLAARVAWACADNALQIHGGNGFALEYPISRMLCDARILNIFEGAAEIQAQVIARRLLEDQRQTEMNEHPIDQPVRDHRCAQERAHLEILYRAICSGAAWRNAPRNSAKKAVEARFAACRGNKQAIVAESADVLYHLLVVWAASGVKPEMSTRRSRRAKANRGSMKKRLVKRN